MRLLTCTSEEVPSPDPGGQRGQGYECLSGGQTCVQRTLSRAGGRGVSRPPLSTHLGLRTPPRCSVSLEPKLCSGQSLATCWEFSIKLELEKLPGMLALSLTHLLRPGPQRAGSETPPLSSHLLAARKLEAHFDSPQLSVCSMGCMCDYCFHG